MPVTGAERMRAFWGVDGTSINWKLALFLPAAWVAVSLVGQFIFAMMTSYEFTSEGVISDVFMGVLPLWVAGLVVFRFKQGSRETVTALMAAALAVLLWLPLGGISFLGKGFPMTSFISMIFFSLHCFLFLFQGADDAVWQGQAALGRARDRVLPI